MSTVTPINVTRLGDSVYDRELEELDDAMYHAEQRIELMHARVNELEEQRMAELSRDDLLMAFEQLATDTYRNSLESLRKGLMTDDPMFVPMFRGMIRGLLVPECFEQARAEFKALDEAKSGDRH